MQAEHTGLTLVQKKLRHFFGLLLLAGVCRRKREATAELWSTDRPEFQRPLRCLGTASMKFCVTFGSMTTVQDNSENKAVKLQRSAKSSMHL
ncbi:hypothetical protein T4C_11967 [Trichinella pseudospiralis]|uniref:PiggyBac transposable element-derived protein domain-containing protein n=1 Tax=Trichinella pseudospiralis TaxID=6337 RepID=A0A0V1JZ98_TRIPS|nr:hypothetical protein T4C_11967 [Trichinella pseudospiralis]